MINAKNLYTKTASALHYNTIISTLLFKALQNSWIKMSNLKISLGR